MTLNFLEQTNSVGTIYTLEPNSEAALWPKTISGDGAAGVRREIENIIARRLGLSSTIQHYILHNITLHTAVSIILDTAAHVTSTTDGEITLAATSFARITASDQKASLAAELP